MVSETKTGLWNKTSQNGNTYASGKVTLDGKEYRITLFVNNNKKNENSPDYQIIFDEQEPKEYIKSVQSMKAEEVTLTDDDLPF